MTIALPKSVLHFAKTVEAQEPYLLFLDYFNHYRSMNGKEGLEYAQVRGDGTPISFSEKEDQMNAALKREILRASGIQNIDAFPLATWSTHPVISWATFAIVGALVDMVLPDTVADDIGLYTDIRNIGFGDSAAFDIEPRDLFAVSRAGAGMRTTEVQKQHTGQVTILPENRQLTTGVDLYRVLAGKESLAKYVAKVIKSFEFQISLDAYTAFLNLVEALSATANTGLRVSGYTQDEMTRLCETVESWNGGQEAVIFGTRRALASLLPLNANYRFDLDNSDFMKMGYVGEAFGFKVIRLSQKADYRTSFSTLIDNDNLYILSPSADKLIKLVFEGTTLANVSGVWENADLSQTSTMAKRWGTGVATSAVAGIIQL